MAIVRQLTRPPRTDHSELIRRGVELILNGALDEMNETDLASQLAVSARHLRRLFLENLGATPDGLARSARVHTARDLLLSTSLPVTQIAFDAGFRSLRQFNRACREAFGATPTDVRAHSADQNPNHGALELQLAFESDLDWQGTLTYLATQATPGVESVHGGIYRRTIVSRDKPGIVELTQSAPRHLLLRVVLPQWSDDLLAIVERARRIAALDFPVHAANTALIDRPTLGPLVKSRPGVRPPGVWDPFEAAVQLLIGNQPTFRPDLWRLVRGVGTRVRGFEQFGLTHTFPSPETLSQASLSECRLSRQQTEAVKSFARAVCVGTCRFDYASGGTEVNHSLLARNGLVDAAADHLAMRLGYPDAWPVDDLLISRAAKALRVRPNHLVRSAEQTRPWRALTAMHLWLVAGAIRVPSTAIGIV